MFLKASVWTEAFFSFTACRNLSWVWSRCWKPLLILLYSVILERLLVGAFAWLIILAFCGSSSEILSSFSVSFWRNSYSDHDESFSAGTDVNPRFSLQDCGNLIFQNLYSSMFLSSCRVRTSSGEGSTTCGLDPPGGGSSDLHMPRCSHTSKWLSFYLIVSRNYTFRQYKNYKAQFLKRLMLYMEVVILKYVAT